MGKLLSREAIIKADDMTFEDVNVPEWGGTVRVKALSGYERDRFESSLQVGKGKKRSLDMNNVRAKLVALTVIDETGEPLFKPNDVDALGKKSSRALDRVFGVAQRLAGISEADMDELTENFPSARKGDSTSA